MGRRSLAVRRLIVSPCHAPLLPDCILLPALGEIDRNEVDNAKSTRRISPDQCYRGEALGDGVGEAPSSSSVSLISGAS
jgi:hypothetical protein